MSVTFYPKVRTIGHREISELFDGEVVIQEKVDGSNFSFGRDEHGELFCLSRTQRLSLDNPEKQFAPAVEYVKDLSNRGQIPAGYIFRCEYLRAPKSNVLAYSRIPKNHLALFEMSIISSTGNVTNIGDSGVTLDRWSRILDIDLVDEIHRGEFGNYSDFLEWLNKEGILGRESFLGGQKIEGVVVKNFNRFSVHGGILLGKFVRAEFKEQHRHVMKSEKSCPVDLIGASFGGPARWHKAVQRLSDEGRLVGAPEDIPALLQQVAKDVHEECAEEAKEALWNHFKGHVVGGARRGLAEWYKGYLTQNLRSNPAEVKSINESKLSDQD